MSKLLPTANPAWGFWGTSDRNGYDKELTWEVAYDAISIAFDLTMQEVRDLLDSSFGRHLVDDLSFITIGPKSAEAIELHIIAYYEPACCRGLAEVVRGYSRDQDVCLKFYVLIISWKLTLFKL